MPEDTEVLSGVISVNRTAARPRQLLADGWYEPNPDSSWRTKATHPLRNRDFSRILLIKPSSLGEVVAALPVLELLRERFPAARIDWLIRPELADLVRHHPAAPGVVFARQGAVAGLQLLRHLRQRGYDLVVDLHGQFRSAVFVLATGAPVRIGFPPPRFSRNVQGETRTWRGARDGSWLAYTHYLPPPAHGFQENSQHSLAALLDLKERGEERDLKVEPYVYLPPWAYMSARILLDSQGMPAGAPYAVLVPESPGKMRRWEPIPLAREARALLEEGFAVVLAGEAAACERCAEVAKACPEAIDLCGVTSVAEFGALIAGAALCITRDSGPLRYAAALGRPVRQPRERELAEA